LRLGDQAHVRQDALLARDEQARPCFAPFKAVALCHGFAHHAEASRTSPFIVELRERALQWRHSASSPKGDVEADAALASEVDCPPARSLTAPGDRSQSRGAVGAALPRLSVSSSPATSSEVAAPSRQRQRRDACWAGRNDAIGKRLRAAPSASTPHPSSCQSRTPRWSTQRLDGRRRRVARLANRREIASEREALLRTAAVLSVGAMEGSRRFREMARGGPRVRRRRVRPRRFCWCCRAHL